MSWRRPYYWLLFGSSRWDLPAFVVAGVLPFVAAVFYGMWNDKKVDTQVLRTVCPDLREPATFLGLESTPNWWIYPLGVLALAVFLLRQMTRLTIGAGPEATPTVAELVPEPGKEAAAERVRRAVLSARVPAVALAIIAIIAAFELTDLYQIYQLRKCPGEKDWSVMFLSGDPSRAVNAAFVAAAYALQYPLGFVVLVTIGLALVHNVLFLRIIYQRRRKIAPANAITLDLNDRLDSFGQHRLRPMFRYQVLFVIMTGCVVAISRYHNVTTNATALIWKRVLESKEGIGQLGAFVQALGEIEVRRDLLPDPGQVALAILFICVFGVVALPSFVKFLPFGHRRVLQYTDLGVYLAEFIPPETGIEPTTMGREPLRALARQFACNSFWPAGDRWAAMLFTFAFAVLIFVLLPVPLAPASLVVQYLALLFTLSAGFTFVTFKVYKYILALIDIDLTKPKGE